MAASIAPQYYVRLLDPNGVQVDMFDQITSIEVNDLVNGVGSITLMFDALSEERKARFMLDGQILVYRSVPGVELDWYIESEGFFRKLTDTIDTNGKRSYQVVAVGYNSLLEGTVIAYKEGTVKADKYDKAETVMKEYVEENCGPSATISNGRLRRGVLKNFSVAPSYNFGPRWSGSRAFENLLDTLKAIGEYARLDFDVLRVADATFLFRTYNRFRGNDRTAVNVDSVTGFNPYGRAPVILSAEFGTSQKVSYTNDRLSEANVCFVLGEGEGSTRKVIYRDRASAVDDSPWNRKEISRPCQTAYIPGLSPEALAELETYSMEQTGDEALDEAQAKEDITITPMQQESSVYGKHYFIGDRVTLQYGNRYIDKRIMGRQIRVQGNQETITLDLSNFKAGTQ